VIIIETMEERIYHGQIKPYDFARDLIAHFNRGNLRAQQIGEDEKIVVQIATSQMARSGGHTALTVHIQSVEDGVSVRLGQQAWFGVAASLGMTALAVLRNPLSLLGRLDDIAQDIESLQLSEKIWQVVDGTARSLGITQELSERLKRVTCSYCGIANPIGDPSCIACGAPLGSEQPETCKKCGFVIKKDECICPNCGQPL